MAVKKFRKKPVVVEAVQWTGENVEEAYVELCKKMIEESKAGPQKPAF